MNKMLSIHDLFKKVETEQNDVSYVNYWAEPEESFLSQYINEYGLKTKTADTKTPICNGCKVCQISHIEKYKKAYPSHPVESERKQALDSTAFPTHPFQITCPLIPDSYVEYGKALTNLSGKEVESILPNIDPVEFAKRFLRWKPRAHQELALRCQSKKKVYRFGRRSGKSDVLCVEILYHAFTKIREFYDTDLNDLVMGIKILICCPFDSQVSEIFKRLKDLLENNPELKKTYKYRQSPYHQIVFENGAIISGFTTGTNGAASVRGQDAHVIILDEVDYMSIKDFETIIPIANSHADCLIRAASTPSGLKSKFYNWCIENPDWKEFYFPTAVIDETPFAQTRLDWKTLRREMRRECTSDSWMQEVMAMFISNADGVFASPIIVKSIGDYTYQQMREAYIQGTLMSGFKFSLGVDWNSSFGTWICITGYHPAVGLQVMEIVNVPKQDFTQLSGLQKITELLSFWKPSYIYVDKGHGATQWETLRMWSIKQPAGSYEFTVCSKIKAYDFGSKIQIKDPATNRIIEHPAKPFLVENSVRRMEDGVVKISIEDELLRKQMSNYIIKNRQPNGTPVYGQNNTNIGDHALDCFMLSMVAWTLEEGPLSISRGNSGFIGIQESLTHNMLANRVSEDELEGSRKTGAELIKYLEALRKQEAEGRRVPKEDKFRDMPQYKEEWERQLSIGNDANAQRNFFVFNKTRNNSERSTSSGRYIR